MDEQTNKRKYRIYQRIAIGIWIAFAISTILEVLFILKSPDFHYIYYNILLGFWVTAWLMVIPSIILYYHASKKIKDKLLLHSRIMLAISLVTLFFTTGILIIAIIGMNKPVIRPSLQLEEGMTPEAAALVSGFAAVASVLFPPHFEYNILRVGAICIFITVFLPFLIASITLKRLSARVENPEDCAPESHEEEDHAL